MVELLQSLIYNKRKEVFMNNKFQLHIAFFTLALACAFVLTACSNLFTEQEQEQMGSISINLGGTARSAGFEGQVGPGTGLPLRHNIRLIQVDGDNYVRIPTEENQSGVIYEQVPAGTYKIEVHAFINGWQYAREAEDTENIAVIAGQTTEVRLQMRRIPEALVLSIPNYSNLAFPTVQVSGTVTPLTITVYNFTDDTVTVSTSSPSGFNISSTMPPTIDTDEFTRLNITHDTITAGRSDTTLNINAGINSISIPLSSVVADNIITTRAQLADLDLASSGEYHVLGADINLSIGGPWTPILFMGSLDGNGHTISGLVVNWDPSSSLWPGLFSVLEGNVKNLALTGVVINAAVPFTTLAGAHAGGLAGSNVGGTIENVYVSGTVNAAFTVPASPSFGSHNFVGGIVGRNGGTIKNSYSDVTVSGHDCVGGIAGLNDYLIENCYATGSITGRWYVGGIVGENNSSTSILRNSVALNPSINRIDGGASTHDFGRVGGCPGWGSGYYINNYARADMSLPSGLAGRPVRDDPGYIDGIDVTTTQAVTIEWWRTLPSAGPGAPGGPDWDVKYSKWEANESSPWYFDYGDNPRPRLWFEEF